MRISTPCKRIKSNTAKVREGMDYRSTFRKKLVTQSKDRSPDPPKMWKGRYNWAWWILDLTDYHRQDFFLENKFKCKRSSSNARIHLCGLNWLAIKAMIGSDHMFLPGVSTGI